ncbi:MAG TPA: nuclear transport factor 2 family protein [Thermoanaerobaculia bacterium]
MTEQHIRAAFDEFAAAWSAHDVGRMAACWFAHGSVVDPWGRFASGREGVAALLTREHTESMGQSTYRIESLDLRELSDETVVAEAECVIDNAIAPNGKPYALKHRVSAVLARDGDAWRFLTLHPTFHARG